MPCARLGAQIRYLGREGFPPLEILPARISVDRPVSVRGEVSSQFLTALLMALPLTGRACDGRGRGRADLQALRRDHAQPDGSLRRARSSAHGWEALHGAGWQRYASPGAYHVEGDASSASYFLAAGAIGGGPVRVVGVGRDSIQGDVRFTEALAGDGRGVDFGDNWIEARAPGARQAARPSTST